MSVEHLVIALAEEGSAHRGRAAAGRAGLTRDSFLGALTQVRGNQRVTSATPEGSLRGAGEVRARPGREAPRRQASIR